MFWLEMALALAIALFLSLAYAAALRETSLRTSPVLGRLYLLAFFATVFLATWAAGAWIRPLGPPVWGVYWMSFLFVGLLVALILAAAAQPPKAAEVAERVDAIRVTLGVLFWSLAAFLLFAVVTDYLD